MKGHDFVRRDGGKVIVSIDATPGASRTEVTGVNRWRGSLQIRLAAEAKEGAANEELVRFLSEVLGVPRRDVEIARGHRSTRKSVRVPGEPDAVAKRLLEGL